jgi:hypothetical protein
MSAPAIQTPRERSRRLNPGRVAAYWPGAAPTLSHAEQSALERDLDVLINQGLVAAIGDGPEARYAVIDGKEGP